MKNELILCSVLNIGMGSSVYRDYCYEDFGFPSFNLFHLCNLCCFDVLNISIHSDIRLVACSKMSRFLFLKRIKERGMI